MNLDELRTVQSKERSKDSLQHLRESFYADVADYIADLKDQREEAAERADSPFDDPDVNRLTDEIKTAEDVVEAIYERRVGKIVKRASLAATGMPADEEGLTGEEQDLFEGLVERIESNKQDVLDVLAGEAESPAESSPTPTPAEGAADSAAQTEGATPDSAPNAAGPTDRSAAPDPGDSPGTAGSGEDVSAADVMGESGVGGDSSGGSTPDASDSASDGQRPAAAEAAAIADESDGGPAGRTGADSTGEPADSTDESAGALADSATSTPDAAGGAPASDSAAGVDADADDPLAGLDERTTVRLTDDVGEIFGVDERTYDLEREDVVTLPEANAAPLVERGAAEELE
jgi:DNA replication factor GINS